MHSDARQEFRPLLQSDLPDFIDRVDTPWDNLPDYSDFNAAAYKHIVRDLERLKKAARNGRPSSRGILVLGDSGTGKTHLLMRVARNLAKANHILFVRRPNDEESVAQHVWANIVSSLGRELPGSGKARTQLDDLLAHVFTSVLIPEFEQDAREGKDAALKRRWANLLRKDPYNLFDMLGEGENRTATMRAIRSRTLRYLQRVHPEVDQQIAHALITYCFVSGETRRRVVLTWLSGQEIDEREAQAMGLPSAWVEVEESSADTSHQQRREERALRAIATIGFLSTHYQPLVLAFDQLEGLRGEERLTRRWGDVVREIFTMAPNFLVVTCIFPSLWEHWFQSQLDASAAQRISEQRVMLEPFQPQHGLRLLEKHMEAAFVGQGLPSSIYPFTEEDVARLCSEATSPRLFIQAARAAFDAWLDEGACPTPMVSTTEGPSIVTQADIDVALGRAFDKFEKEQRANYGTEITTEQDVFGRIRCLIQLLMEGQHVEYGKAAWGHYVMPPNVLVRSRTYGDRLCVGVMNGDSRPFTTRIRNFTAAFRDGDQFSRAILLRDCRSRPVSEKGKEYLDEFLRRKGHFLSVTADEVVLLNALYDTLVAVEQQNVSVGTCQIGKSHLRQFVVNSGTARRSVFLQTASSITECFEQALRSSPSNEDIAAQPSCALLGPEAITLDEISEEVAELVDGLADLDEVTDTTVESAELVGASVTAEFMTESSGTDSQTRKNVAGGFRAEEGLPEGESSVPSGRPKVDALIGDTNLDCTHIGVLGELVDTDKVLGISLSKPQCIVLLGYMGSGKSYALGVLVENALLASSPIVQSTRPMTVVAFNYRRNPEARFEYWGFSQPNSRNSEVETLAAKYGASPLGVGDVNVFGYGPELKRRLADYRELPTYPIQFRAEELGAEHWAILMKPPTPQAEYMDVIRDIIQKLYYQDRLTFRNLERAIETDTRLSESQRKRAKNRLSFAARWLTDERPYEWADVLKEGAMNIFDLRMQTLSSDEALKLCLVITDLVRRTRNGVNKMIVFDEAHEYVDCKELIGELENAITQIRHDGLSFVLASQFPERIPERIFKYLATKFIFKLPTGKAINYLKKAAPNLKTLSLERVANLGLERGICFVQTDDDCTDDDLAVPQLLSVRPRCSLHGGATVRHV